MGDDKTERGRRLASYGQGSGNLLTPAPYRNDAPSTPVRTSRPPSISPWTSSQVCSNLSEGATQDPAPTRVSSIPILTLSNSGLSSSAPLTQSEFHEHTNLGYSPFEAVQWILKQPGGILKICTLRDLRTAFLEHLSTPRSLTLGQVKCDEEMCDALCGFANLTEFRIV